jgi:hypothetical protein
MSAGSTMVQLWRALRAWQLAPTLASSQDSTPQMHAYMQCFGKRVCNACIWIITIYLTPQRCVIQHHPSGPSWLTAELDFWAPRGLWTPPGQSEYRGQVLWDTL